MGRIADPDAEEKIIDATIKIGGSSPANVNFSTKDIAKKAGVSEYLIFSRFGSKINLIHFACLRASGLCNAECLRLSKNVNDPLEIYSSLLSYLIKHKEQTLFLLNYGEGNTKVGKPGPNYEAFKKDAIKKAKLFTMFSFGDDDACFLAYSTFARNVLIDAELVLNGSYKDSNEYRRFCAKLAFRGHLGD
ncbi:MAG: TetR family transcriptional regulator [Bacilli bacterium]|jgi:AcrR family transcriptional regulator|nr:TetR family transcriptional regulator [Bacilli bacterium]MCH4210952.1 TetR family transcriptional regulator [Bacilli bacterium]MCH4228224.1 TetR family transcriptional regulator [Bacilli bacterium]MCH4277422.1 TetR family transcriptional regulator [Bacilli bacterium]MCI2055265.1 TetR family transcriptional regulator [Bacilli bacterium]